MGILVQKFGGTSVASVEKMNEVCNIIEQYKKKGNDLVIVVSAMGRKGEPYATDTLINLCTNVNKKSKKRELDLIMSCGEIISGTILSSMLEARGIPSVFLTGMQAGIITTKVYSNSKIKEINPTRIHRELDEGKVVVIAGFQGGTEDGEVTTLGRGGSDTSAVAIGKALGSETVQIYTDVDGIMTADPRIEPSAKILDYCDYEEVFQMAEKGAKVIHPRAVELAKNGDIVLEIKNTLNPTCKGTRIGLTRGVTSNYEDFQSRFMTSVAHKDNIAQIKVKSSEELFSKILNEMEEKHINLDMINFFTEEKAFALEQNYIFAVEEILQKYDVKYDIRKHCAKVTLIGSKVTETPGVIAKVVRALSKAGITLLQSSDSYTCLTCLVKEEDMIETVHAIHNEFAD
ncbi:MAG: aspartate kinase [Terrisporobacter othiniensis]|uniref:Aspartokinase n=2 Tax=Terrisporobacter TaxID=1505652 RepID=A0AAX2ZGY2_9FIRM|nr:MULTISPECIES: aspartate kinase [Terrisporobacter]MBN9646361.1 aspartate kinase [Terrisporobacter glycolicus]MDU4859689.1 aspartate kinase [Terrisporobacter othiniensis]MDU6994142.1 aspartate kinase [Terrisporobacter othiniensis]UEL46972.1 aspartate kinase [Terrisporobacter hibernicus]UPA29405.1 aspartate kinase [Terrisporobacter glycolicus]